MIGLCGFVAAAPVAVWVAVKYCCSVLSVLLGLFPVACHECDATSALGFACGCFQCYISLVVCASPHFQLVTVAGGLFRTVSHTPFVSLGNAALATYPNNLSGKSSWVIGRASSTHVSVCSTCTVQSRTRPWSYSVVIIVLVLSNPLKDGNADGY